ncbi:MAG TPA: CopG family transcriptional regulator [Terriglobales bacterium]|nr:CopG family transcriptional regulator [Terriglobales bacterium]
MKPLQVYVEEADLARLDAWSRERKMTKSQAIRVAIRALTRSQDDEPLLSLSGAVYDDLPADCSARFDQYLQETFVAETPATYARRRRPARPRARR